MGKFGTSGPEQAQTVVSGTFVATGTSASAPFLGKFNFALWGTFAGTVSLQKSYDGGSTWIIARDMNGNAMTLTAPDTHVVEEDEPGVLYDVTCSAYTSGTVSYRISAGASRSNDARFT
ncbi:hypothetical protein [Paraburkholderia phenazinium]|uniref:Uncharacterized protein n=1 Tax=Paraburkholderia phenazinium TaxID=60549 RepID=A0A1N6KPF1_9BURK|nr:hypothetical protein [Paraburkholderia phenazinium]SIO58403.1 hypothetical protein SAMN05444165_4132 [Paraburkholderia phenazinium]